jgi:hypothetical protein
MIMANDIFNTLCQLDVSKQFKEKNGLRYLSWARAWDELKKVYPDASFVIHKQLIDPATDTWRPWFDDGRTGWVEVSVTVKGETVTEWLSIMDYKNNAIPADAIKSTDANKAFKRCLTKACALHGLALYLYEGDDLPSDIAEVVELRKHAYDIFKKKYEINPTKTMEVCKEAERKSKPDATEEEITGDFKDITDLDILKELEKKLLMIRKG